MIHSLSKLGTFEKCGAKYRFQYVDRLPGGEKSASASRGIDYHEMMEHYILGRLTKLEPPLDFYQNWLDGLKAIPGAVPEAKLAMSVDWSSRDWDADDIWWRGVLDLLVPPRAGTASVYDWKTGKIYDDHEQQREIYSLATFALYPEAREVDCYHVYVDLQKTVKQSFHRDLTPDLQNRWGRRFRALETAVEFPYNPQYSCRWCQYSKAQGGPCPF